MDERYCRNGVSRRPPLGQEAFMPARSEGTVANAFVRAFPKATLRTCFLRQIGPLLGAVLLVWLLLVAEGLDLGVGLF
jgi:hypothetical protein